MSELALQHFNDVRNSMTTYARLKIEESKKKTDVLLSSAEFTDDEYDTHLPAVIKNLNEGHEVGLLFARKTIPPTTPGVRPIMMITLKNVDKTDGKRARIDDPVEEVKVAEKDYINELIQSYDIFKDEKTLSAEEVLMKEFEAILARYSYNRNYFDKKPTFDMVSFKDHYLNIVLADNIPVIVEKINKKYGKVICAVGPTNSNGMGIKFLF